MANWFRFLVKLLPLLQLTGSGIFMTLVALGMFEAPVMFTHVGGDASKASKFEWASAVLPGSLSTRNLFLLFGVCKVAAAISWFTHRLETLSTICVLTMYGGILYSHVALGDDLMPLVVLGGLTLVKLVLGKEDAAVKVKGSE